MLYILEHLENKVTVSIIMLIYVPLIFSFVLKCLFFLLNPRNAYLLKLTALPTPGDQNV